MIELLIMLSLFVLLALLAYWTASSVNKLNDRISNNDLALRGYSDGANAFVQQQQKKIDSCESRIEQHGEDLKELSMVIHKHEAEIKKVAEGNDELQDFGEVLNKHDMFLSALSTSVEKLHRLVRRHGIAP